MVYSKYGVDLEWGDDNRLALSGNTFTTLPTNGNSRAHNVLNQSISNIEDMNHSGFYYVPPNVIDNLDESIGSGNDNQDWHLIQNTISGPGSTNYTWQMAKAIRVGSENPRMTYRSVEKDSNDIVSLDAWSTVATTDDVDLVQSNLDTYIVDRSNDGIWFGTIAGDNSINTYLNQYSSLKDEVYPLERDANPDDTIPDNTYKYHDIAYTIIGDTLHYNVFIKDLKITRIISSIRAWTHLNIRPYALVGGHTQASALHEVGNEDDVARINPLYMADGGGVVFDNTGVLVFDIVMDNSDVIPANKAMDFNISGTLRIAR
jgi:hypothetical protein